MINTEIIRSEIYTRVDMRGTNHEIEIDKLLETWENQRQHQHSLNQMDMSLRDKVDKTTAWCLEEEHQKTRNERSGGSTFDTWERVIGDNQIIGQNYRGSRDLDETARMIHQEKDYRIQVKGEVGNKISWMINRNAMKF
jgi:hypothetical protein